jgi:hypothetical protein
LIRHQLAVFLLIGVSLASAVSLLLDAAKAYSVKPETSQTAAFQGRFAEIRRALPSHGVVGYVTDAAPNQATRTTEFYLTQYALSPVVLVDDPNQKLVVANFHSVSPDQALLSATRLTPVRNFGNGVFLLRGSQ